MLKVTNKLTVPLMNEIFLKRNNAYNLRKSSEFARPKVYSVFHLLLVVRCLHQNKIFAMCSMLITFKASYRKTVHCLDYSSYECGVSL